MYLNSNESIIIILYCFAKNLSQWKKKMHHFSLSFYITKLKICIKNKRAKKHTIKHVLFNTAVFSVVTIRRFPVLVTPSTCVEHPRRQESSGQANSRTQQLLTLYFNFEVAGICFGYNVTKNISHTQEHR